MINGNKIHTVAMVTIVDKLKNVLLKIFYPVNCCP